MNFFEKAAIACIPLVGPVILGRINDAEDSDGYSEPVRPRHTRSAQPGCSYTEDYDEQQRSRNYTSYRGIRLRSLDGSGDAEVKQTIDDILDGGGHRARDFRRNVKEIDHARVLRHRDGSAPTGFAGRGDRNGGGVISLRTAQIRQGLERTATHELGHLVDGDSEEAAESYAHGTGVYE